MPLHTLESNWLPLASISHCTNDLYVHTPAYNNKNYKSNPVPIMEPNYLCGSEFNGKQILLTLFSHSELTKEMVLAAEEKLPLVCQV